MKFKIYHFLIVYEVMTFLHEMYKRKASSVRFELQESVGKVNIYIDDSSFKQIDGSIAWRIVKGMYHYLAKKDNNPAEFDKDSDFKGTFNTDDFNKFKLNIFPLPKGKCISYSYITKPGSIYEVSFSLSSNSIDDLIKELMIEKNSLNATNDMIFKDLSDNGSAEITYELEGITFKNNKLRIFLDQEDGLNDDPIIKTFKDEDIDNKKKIKAIFDRMTLKNENIKPKKKKDIDVDVEETETESPKKITW